MLDKEERGSTKLALKAGAWYTISTFLLRAVAFITVPIFTRLMTKLDYGEFTNYANWQAILLIITSAELYSTLPRAYYDYTGRKYDEYISSVLVLNIILTAVVYILFLICSDWVYSIVSIPSEFVNIMFFTLLCSSFKTIYLARERTLYRYKSVVLVSAIDTVIPTVIAILLVLFSNDSAKLSARIYGFYLPSAIIGLILGILMFNKAKTSRIRDYKYALKLSLPLLINYLTMSLLISTNIIIAKNILGPEESAVIGIAVSLTHILSILFQAVSGALTTWLMDNLNTGNYEKIREEMVFFVIVLSVISVGVIMLTPEIVMILGGIKYAATVDLVPWLVFSTLIQSLVTLFTIILTYAKKVMLSGLIAGILAVSSIILKIFLLPKYGLISLPIVNIIISIVMFAADYTLVCLAGYKRTINICKFVAIISVVGVFVIFSNYLYNNLGLRYLIIVIGIVSILVFLLTFKTKIKNIIGKKEGNDE